MPGRPPGVARIRIMSELHNVVGTSPPRTPTRSWRLSPDFWRVVSYRLGVPLPPSAATAAMSRS